jgi:hypothetical protein
MPRSDIIPRATRHVTSQAVVRLGGRDHYLGKPGTPVSAKDVVGLFDELCRRPFRTISQILFGETMGCPGCKGERLGVMDRAGACGRTAWRTRSSSLVGVPSTFR